MSYTQANKTCQGKLGRLCGALSQGKLVQLYTRAIKTCQGKLLGKNLFIVHTSKESYQGTCEGKLGLLYGALVFKWLACCTYIVYYTRATFLATIFFCYKL